MEPAAQLLRLLLLLLLSVQCFAQKVTKKEFDSALDLPRYFEHSDTVLITERASGKLWRSDNGGEDWNPAVAERDHEIDKVVMVYMHPHDGNIAFALTRGSQLFYTHDQGAKWETLRLPQGLGPASDPFSFHAGDSKKIVFNTQDCLLGGFFCEEQAWYSNDGLATIEMITIPRPRDDNRPPASIRQCMFARSKPEFKSLADEGGADRILCVVEDRTRNVRLYITDDFFETPPIEPQLSNDRTVTGIVSIAAVKGYLLVAARAEKTTELALFVSVDGKIWHQTVFKTNHKLEENGYTVLESTNYSVQVIVQGHDHSTFLSSNSNGTYFQENLDRVSQDIHGYADFEKVQGFQGVILANVVDSSDDKKRKTKEKKHKSKISFHDGKGEWRSLKADDDKELHLHSVTEAHNIGRVFSSAAPGVMLGIGNTGSHLKAYNDGDLYVSNDAGRKWEKTKLKGPHKYQFADEGNVLLAIPDKQAKHDKRDQATKKAQYSLDHGREWKEFELDDQEFIPQLVTTRSDTTSLRVLVVGRRKANDEDGASSTSVVYSINFDEDMEEKFGTCEKGDMEEFSALKDDDPCIMGHRQKYRRRKRDAKCFVRDKSHGPLPENEQCPCGKEDFECAFNFTPEDGKCKPAYKLSAPDGACKNEDDTFEGPSGFQLIPQNDCKREGGEELDKKTERPCSESKSAAPPEDKIVATFHKHGEVADRIVPIYLERTETSQGDDETVLFLDGKHHRVFISENHGKKWDPIDEKHHIFKDHKIINIIPHEFNADAVFFMTSSKTMLFSYNRCRTIHTFEVPHAWTSKDNQEVSTPLSFHPDPDYKNWFIWTGETCEGDECQFESRYTKNRGEDWNTLVHGSNKCEFVQRESRDRNLKDEESKNLIFCQRYSDESLEGPLELVKSKDFFEKDEEIVLDDILTFATMSEFLIVAKKDDESLKVNASVYGGPLAPAQFPPQFDVDSTTAYTLLQSETHSVFLHVTTSKEAGQEFGKIMKSNSNGTFYVTSHDHVNRDTLGYIDFEKVKGLEGVSLINIVANPEEVQKSGAAKKLQTRITHNDGADWSPIKTSENNGKSSEGRNWNCRGASCNIQLYGYTEKSRPERSHSSDTAIGLLIANGIVGSELDPSGRQDSTFISNDGGMKWEVIYTGYSGRNFWAYGDQGSIIVLVREKEKTKTLSFSLREGQGFKGDVNGKKVWETFEFTDEEIVVEDLTTLPSDNSKSFLIWGRKGKELVTINVDFSALRNRQCNLDEEDPNAADSDYTTWSPKHPDMELDEDCLFGHQSLYHRKKLDAECWNGRRIPRLHDIAKNCTCQNYDFECDYNYQRVSSGNCMLADGYEPPDHSQICRDDPNAIEYYESRGYRKIPLDTCVGGMELDKIADPIPCPGHEEEFKERHRGLSGFAFFLVAICLPFAAAAGIGWWVYQRWDGKFGAIRLGENTPEGILDIDKPWVKYPVMVLSALAAIAMAVPEMVGSAWRGINELIGRRSGKYTSRASFARGRGEYTVVDDEDELLGDDDDDEV